MKKFKGFLCHGMELATAFLLIDNGPMKRRLDNDSYRSENRRDEEINIERKMNKVPLYGSKQGNGKSA